MKRATIYALLLYVIFFSRSAYAVEGEQQREDPLQPTREEFHQFKQNIRDIKRERRRTRQINHVRCLFCMCFPCCWGKDDPTH